MLAAAAALGCVERRLLIRSEPSGAPVWVDEVPVGQTPVDYEFAHYGVRRVRVGPLRDEQGNLTHLAAEQLVEVRAPWYETFPIDFFAEVIWPATLVDEHQAPTLQLQEAPEAGRRPTAEEVEQIRERARAYREEALREVPEAAEEAPAD
jgi:hypothetical protein